MKLLFINQSLGIGGAETFNKELLVWLQNQGIFIKTYVTNKKFQKTLNENKIISSHIPVIVDIIGNWRGLIKGLFLLPFAFFYYLFLVLKNRNTDILLMTGYIEKILVTPIAKIFKISIVWIEFAPLGTIFNKFFGLPKFLYSFVKKLPVKIIVPSEHTLSSLSKELNQERSNFLLIPCARNIDIKLYSKIIPQKNTICCVSRLEQGKGQDLLLKAWVIVEKAIPEARLTIIGEGDFKNTLDKIVKNLALKQVNFKGYVKDALIEIANSEVFVFPTVWPLEGFGLVAVEAMALGKPVICFDSGPVAEIVNQKTGIVVKNKNTEKLALALIKLLKEKNLAQKLGREGEKIYRKNFTFDKIGPKYLSLFKKIV